MDTETREMANTDNEMLSKIDEKEDSGRYISEMEFNRRVEEIQDDWRRQGDLIKGLDPSFDLEKAFQNPDFYDAVVNGGKTVVSAYTALNVKVPRRNISEIGNLTSGVCPSVSHDINSMSDREFDDYIRKIKNS